MSTDFPESADVENGEFLDDDGVLYDDEVTPEPGILGFTLRELLIVSIWLVAFVVSFFPLAAGEPVWGLGIQWILPIGVPTAAVFLIVLRRFSPDGIRRVGSLGIDQFASVAFSVAAVTWLSALWAAVASTIEFDIWTLNWVGIIQLLASIALVVLTVFAPLIPGLKEDFHGRLVTLAHRNANPVRPVVARPRPERDDSPTAADVAATGSVDAQETATDASLADEPVADEPVAEPGAVEETPTRAVPTDDAVTSRFATDEVARLDLPGQVPLAAHASGGGTGTAPDAGQDATTDDGYVPAYSRRSRNDEIYSTTSEIESFLEEVAVDVPDERTPAPSADEGEGSPASAARVSNPVDDASAQPFWILAPTERAVYDERGEPLFLIGPSAWSLVIEDRGGAFVVRHDDGRIGYLHDISDITKG